MQGANERAYDIHHAKREVEAHKVDLCPMGQLLWGLQPKALPWLKLMYPNTQTRVCIGSGTVCIDLQ